MVVIQVTRILDSQKFHLHAPNKNDTSILCHWIEMLSITMFILSRSHSIISLNCINTKGVQLFHGYRGSSVNKNFLSSHSGMTGAVCAAFSSSFAWLLVVPLGRLLVRSMVSWWWKIFTTKPYTLRSFEPSISVRNECIQTICLVLCRWYTEASHAFPATVCLWENVKVAIDIFLNYSRLPCFITQEVGEVDAFVLDNSLCWKRSMMLVFACTGAISGAGEVMDQSLGILGGRWQWLRLSYDPREKWRYEKKLDDNSVSDLWQQKRYVNCTFAFINIFAGAKRNINQY